MLFSRWMDVASEEHGRLAAAAAGGANKSSVPAPAGRSHKALPRLRELASFRGLGSRNRGKAFFAVVCIFKDSGSRL